LSSLLWQIYIRTVNKCGFGGECRHVCASTIFEFCQCFECLCPSRNFNSGRYDDYTIRSFNNKRMSLENRFEELDGFRKDALKFSKVEPEKKSEVEPEKKSEEKSEKKSEEKSKDQFADFLTKDQIAEMQSFVGTKFFVTKSHITEEQLKTEMLKFINQPAEYQITNKEIITNLEKLPQLTDHIKKLEKEAKVAKERWKVAKAFRIGERVGGTSAVTGSTFGSTTRPTFGSTTRPTLGSRTRPKFG